MKKSKDDRKEFKIRYRISEDGIVNFIDPCCDDIPAELFMNLLSAIAKVEISWNIKKTRI